MAERETTKRWIDAGTVAFAVGGLGVAATSIIGEPRMEPQHTMYIAAEWASWIAMISGGTVAINQLKELYDQLQPHRHSGVNSHTHKPEDITGSPAHEHE